jgi:hypothetical protein
MDFTEGVSGTWKSFEEPKLVTITPGTLAAPAPYVSITGLPYGRYRFVEVKETDSEGFEKLRNEAEIKAAYEVTYFNSTGTGTGAGLEIDWFVIENPATRSYTVSNRESGSSGMLKLAKVLAGGNAASSNDYVFEFLLTDLANPENIVPPIYVKADGEPVLITGLAPSTYRIEETAYWFGDETFNHTSSRTEPTGDPGTITRVPMVDSSLASKPSISSCLARAMP